MPESAGHAFAGIEGDLGAVSVLVMCHCESVDSGLLDTTIESFDRHFAVNARATWLLIRELGRRYRAAEVHGRIIVRTSNPHSCRVQGTSGLDGERNLTGTATKR